MERLTHTGFREPSAFGELIEVITLSPRDLSSKENGLFFFFYYKSQDVGSINCFEMSSTSWPENSLLENVQNLMENNQSKDTMTRSKARKRRSSCATTVSASSSPTTTPSNASNTISLTPESHHHQAIETSKFYNMNNLSQQKPSNVTTEKNLSPIPSMNISGVWRQNISSTPSASPVSQKRIDISPGKSSFNMSDCILPKDKENLGQTAVNSRNRSGQYTVHLYLCVFVFFSAYAVV